MKKTVGRAFALFLTFAMIFTMNTWVFAASAETITPEDLKASMRNANLLPNPTDADERALRADYLPYTGYFEESFTSGAASGRSARFYIPEGAHIREYFLALALPSGTDIERFLVESGWIEIADANRVCLMILLPNGDEWGSYGQERAYVDCMMNGVGTSRRWYSTYSEFYVVGYGDGGDIIQQWAAEEPLFITSQAYFDSNIDPDALVSAGEYYYVHQGQTAATSATPSVDFTFESVQKKDIPVPTYFFGDETPEGAINYWKYANECDASVETGAGPLGSDIFHQNKENSKAIATAYSSVVSRVAVLDGKVDYVDPEVSQEVYDALAIYTRYTVTSALSNALGYRPNHEELGVEHVIIQTVEENDRPYNRAYLVYVPEKVKDKNLYPNGAPIVYAFGGMGNNATQFFEGSQWYEIANECGFSLVMPSEAITTSGVTTGWRIGVHEYNFVLDVMEDVNGKYGEYIDQSRVYATGHSQGGGMVNYLSLVDPELFTAYSILAGLAQSFPEGTPTVPMYCIYGEYDSVSYLPNRNNWLARNGFDPDAYVITNPFNLPQRYNNPIGYLIYPNTPEYPGDKFVTYTWYDENGIPMFNDTTALGREHNNTVPDAWKTWNDWFSKWSRDENGNRVYQDAPVSSDIVKLTTDAHLVKAGDYFTLNATFTERQSSNAAILTYTFDGDKFEYANFTPADGVQVVNTVYDNGVAKITVISRDYDLESFGDIMLRAKEDAALVKEFQTVALAAEYVVKDENGDKEILAADAFARFTTFGGGEGGPAVPGDTNDDGVVDLIDLSNLIDWFGMDETDSEWDTLYIFFDFNNSGDMDIYDISYVAKLIQ